MEGTSLLDHAVTLLARAAMARASPGYPQHAELLQRATNPLASIGCGRFCRRLGLSCGQIRGAPDSRVKRSIRFEYEARQAPAKACWMPSIRNASGIAQTASLRRAHQVLVRRNTGGERDPCRKCQSRPTHVRRPLCHRGNTIGSCYNVLFTTIVQCAYARAIR